MRTTAGKLWASAGLAVVLATCVYGAAATQPAAHGASIAGSLVRVDVYTGDKVEKADAIDGHGSGVYIGNDVVLTAWHVVNGHMQVMLKLDDGSEQVADVLWTNDKYDVAAVRPQHSGKLTAADLACVSPKRGDAVTTAGSPGDDDDIYAPGVVVGNERAKGPWASVVVTNALLAPGMSGGPSYDAAGHVVGISVGVALTQIGDQFHPDGSMTGFNYVVPGSVICDLLGRA